VEPDALRNPNETLEEQGADTAPLVRIRNRNGKLGSAGTPGTAAPRSRRSDDFGDSNEQLGAPIAQKRAERGSVPRSWRRHASYLGIAESVTSEKSISMRRFAQAPEEGSHR